jgi:hypothetical protein
MAVKVEQKNYFRALRTTGKVPEGPRPDFNGLGDVVQKIEETAIASNGHLRSIETIIQELSSKYPDLAELIEEDAPKVEVEQLRPPLPSDVALEPGVTKGLCPLKDMYVDYSRKKSPEGFEEFHSSCFWSLLSTVAGRRISINLDAGTRQYTSLFVMLAARSTLYAKTETAEVTRLVLKACGLDWLLGSTRVTPQKLLLDMSGPIPESYSEMSRTEQENLQKKLAMSAQRGWLYNEFGKLTKSMMQSTGPMAEFSSVLLQISDCPEELPSGTVVRGDETIKKPYLSILGTLTPASIKTVAGRHAELWSDGLLARFLWSCPPPNTYLDQPFRQGSTAVPSKLIEGIQQWHKDLGEPSLNIIPIIEKVKDKNTKAEVEQPTGRYRKEWVNELNETILSLSADAYNGWVKYRSALKSMIAKLSNHDLDASYGRLSMMALRVAALAASLEGAKQIEHRHWQLGQEQAELWRESLHQLYAQVNANAEIETSRVLVGSLVEYLKKREKRTTIREIKQSGPTQLRELESENIREMLKTLIKDGMVESGKEGKAEWYKYLPS